MTLQYMENNWENQYQAKFDIGEEFQDANILQVFYRLIYLHYGLSLNLNYRIYSSNCTG